MFITGVLVTLMTLIYLRMAGMYGTLAYSAHAISRGSKANDSLSDEDLQVLQRRARKRWYWALGATLSCIVTIVSYDWWLLAKPSNIAALAGTMIGFIGVLVFPSMYRRTKPVSYGTSIDANGTRYYLYADN